MRKELLLFLGLALLLTWQRCDRPDPPGTVTEIVSRGLEHDETHKAIVSTHRAVVLERRKTASGGTEIVKKTTYVPPEGQTEVVVHTDGSVTSSVKRAGLCLAPGVGGAISSEPALVLDVKLAYFNRWGITAGVPFRKDFREWEGPFVAISYNVYKNTGLFLGVAPFGKRPVAGLRISF